MGQSQSTQGGTSQQQGQQRGASAQSGRGRSIGRSARPQDSSQRKSLSDSPAPRGPSPSFPRQSFADAPTLAPQGAAAPLPRTIKDRSRSSRLPDHTSVIGYPGQSALEPAVLTWRYGGSSVHVFGSWDHFTSFTELHHLSDTSSEMNCVKLLPTGVHEYVFVVDGQKRYAPDQPAVVRDTHGEIVNVLQIVDSPSTPQEAEEPPPPSPPGSYTCPEPVADDFSKEPAPIPPQLPMTLLNVCPFPEHPSLLPRPQHVLLNHVYIDKPTYVSGVIALGLTHRYRSKYTSLVIFKPSTASTSRTSGSNVAQAPQQQQQQQQQQAVGHSSLFTTAAPPQQQQRASQQGAQTGGR